MVRRTRDKERISRGLLRKAEMERMMSNGSVAKVTVMARFTLCDCLIEPKMVMIIENSTLVGCVIGFDLWDTFETSQG